MSRPTVQFHLVTADCMAEILAETVAEISDPIAARRTLAFAGFSDEQISIHLRCAQHLARKLRGREIDRLYASQFRNQRPRHG
jgi:hypothetical protein